MLSGGSGSVNTSEVATQTINKPGIWDVVINNLDQAIDHPIHLRKNFHSCSRPYQYDSISARALSESDYILRFVCLSELLTFRRTGRECDFVLSCMTLPFLMQTLPPVMCCCVGERDIG